MNHYQWQKKLFVKLKFKVMSQEKTFPATFLGMSKNQQTNSNGTPFHWGVVALDINGTKKSFPIMVYDAYQEKAELKAQDEINVKFTKVTNAKGESIYICTPEGNGNSYEQASNDEIAAYIGETVDEEAPIEA